MFGRFHPSPTESVTGKFAERSYSSSGLFSHHARSMSTELNSSTKFNDVDSTTEKTIEISSDDFGAQLTERLARTSLGRVPSFKAEYQGPVTPETLRQDLRSNSRSKIRQVKSRVNPSPQAVSTATSPDKPQSTASSLFTDRRMSGALLTRSVIACPEERMIPYRDSPGLRSNQTTSSSKRSVSAGKVVPAVDNTERRSVGGVCRTGETITVTAKSLRKSWEGATGKDGKERANPKQAKTEVKPTLWSSVSTSPVTVMWFLI